jgi:hypothetical protein
MVIGYLLALLGGIVLLRVLTPTTATITAATNESANLCENCPPKTPKPLRRNNPSADAPLAG